VDAQQRLAIWQRAVIVFLGGQQQLGQTLVAGDIENKSDDHQGRKHCPNVDNAAQPFPALSFRVVKNLAVRHRGRVLISARAAETGRVT